MHKRSLKHSIHVLLVSAYITGDGSQEPQNNMLLLCRQIDPLALAKLVSSLDLSPSTEIRAILEQPVPNALNGKWSWFSAGYNSGIWKGVLMSFGVPFETVPANVWKTDMQLRKAGKEGSRLLAQELLPQTLPQLKYVQCTPATSCICLEHVTSKQDPA